MVGLEKGGRIGFGTIRVNVRVDIRVKGGVNLGRVGSGQSQEIAMDINGISEMLHRKH
jgi:hypothetical protein